jgi:adhesin transport system membrane fusion protein
MKKDFSEQDEDYIADAKAVLLNKTSPAASWFLYSIAGFLILFLVWSYFATIEQNVIGEGKVIPASQVKIIQSVDGGIIKDIYVHEGDSVNKGQTLIQLDTTRNQADYEQAKSQYLALLAIVARLRAEVYDEDRLDLSKEFIKENPDLAKRETHLFERRRADLTEDILLLKNSAENTENQANEMLAGVNKGYVAKVDYLRMLLTANDARQRYLTRKNQFYESAWAELNQNNARLESIEEALKSLQDKITHSTLRSPVNGIVKKIYMTTIGGVVQPGMGMVEIVPIEDTLVVETRIMPADIAFVKMGQAVSVKISAYDYSIYGDLQGKVEHISADTIEDKQNSFQANRPYYLVDVRTQKNYIEHQGEKLSIIPGMAATVYIKTGQKTVMQYLLKPLIKAKQEGLHEK